MVMIPFMRVEYGKSKPETPKSKGSRLAAGMAPDAATEPKPENTKNPIRMEGNDNDGKDLIDLGIIHIRHDAIQTLSEKKFGDQVCCEILLNSGGDPIFIKEAISEAARMISMATS